MTNSITKVIDVKRKEDTKKCGIKLKLECNREGYIVYFYHVEHNKLIKLYSNYINTSKKNSTEKCAHQSCRVG